MIERIIENVRILGKKPALLLRTTTTVDDVVLYENLFWSPEERSNFMERYSALKTSRDGKECRRYALSTKNRVAFIRALVSLWASNDHNASIIPIGKF